MYKLEPEALAVSFLSKVYLVAYEDMMNICSVYSPNLWEQELPQHIAKLSWCGIVLHTIRAASTCNPLLAQVAINGGTIVLRLSFRYTKPRLFLSSVKTKTLLHSERQSTSTHVGLS